MQSPPSSSILSQETCEDCSNLSRLLAEAYHFNEEFAKLAPACQTLTEQFWEQHYPGGDLDEVGENYREIRRHIGEMIKIITSTQPLK